MTEKEKKTLPRTVGIGHQDFGQLIQNHYFYIDKTDFIKEWWENGDTVTLITRPRRFGKTLNMSMTEQFFSLRYAGQGKLFANLSIWQEETYRKLQGTYPVIAFTFANIKENHYAGARKKICQILSDLYTDNRFLLESEALGTGDREFFRRVTVTMDDADATLAIHQLSRYLSLHYKKKVIILLDEYDTPMQEAYVNGYWEEMVSFTRSLFNASFKTNPYLERAIMTGITRISKESIFSDLNNLTVVTTTSDMYQDSFGFSEPEVAAALDEYGLQNHMPEIKEWYDGFIFGTKRDIYNPWSILNYLKTGGKLAAYWANSSSNTLISKLIREGIPEIKMVMESLLRGETFRTSLDEQIVFSQLDQSDEAVWSLLLAGGYLRAESFLPDTLHSKRKYALNLTNMEVRFMFEELIKQWFGGYHHINNAFIQALLEGNIESMNEYMNDIASALFSSFDTGRHPSAKTQPERFYHGFVLGLMVELQDRYIIYSNKESGLGRYDILLEPKIAVSLPGRGRDLDAVIIEFKVVHPQRGETLERAVISALEQIDQKQYETVLLQKGIPAERIRKYGFAFEGCRVLIG